jgi:hypothetical protein
MWRILLLLTLAVGGCLPLQTPSVSPAELTQADRLLVTGLTEVVENRPTAALNSLISSYPTTPQADLARQVLAWRNSQPQNVALQGTRKNTIEAELRAAKEENLRLRADIEKLRRLLIDSERSTR